MDSSNPLSASQIPTANPSKAESPSGNTTSQNPAPIQTPPLAVVMQQAVAMQQFQFQQALLMQQVITAQQAATRAATLKSAAEMAAARAAEISKQLKGDDAEDEQLLEKSKSRSVSRSASHSRSPSRTKSSSHSPIRYRRGRSNSRSPIRYRRDYYSPPRSRDYFSHRSHSYRSYYRGNRNEHSRMMYRRERDRNQYYRGSRRSRSRGRRRSRTKSRSPRRSRSRGRRRSRTSSRSPRHRRSHRQPSRHRKERSYSPKHKRDERKLHQISKRSASREARQSRSAISESISGSSFRKAGSRSPSVVKGGNDKLSDAESPLPEEKSTFAKELSLSYSHTDHVDHLQEERVTSSFRKTESPAKTRSSSIPVRSPLDGEQNETGDNENAQERSPDKDSELHVRVALPDDSLNNPKNILKEGQAEKDALKGSGDIVNTGHSISNQENNISLLEITGRKPSIASNTFIDEESEYEEGLDDWRDDLKPAPKETESFNYSSLDTKKMVENEKGTNSNLILERKPNVYTSYDVGIQGNANLEEESNARIPTGSMFLDASISGNARGTGYADKSSIKDDVDVRDDAGEPSDNVIFEGPRPISEDEEETSDRLDSLRAVSEAYVAETELLLGTDGDKGCMIAPDQGRMHDMDSEGDMGGNVERESHKGRHRSCSKDPKKHEDDMAKHEKRRDRHKKHKRKHRHEGVDEDKVEGSDDRKDDGHRTRRRHRRKHKRESEHGHKEKKKRKHKHRVKSPADSAEENFLFEKDEGRDNDEHTVTKKKSSKRHKKSKRDISESPAPSATSSG